MMAEAPPEPGAPPTRPPPRPEDCELCGRAVGGAALTRHHLIPRTRHRKKRALRRFSLGEMRSRILWVCRPCQSHIHRVLSEQELEAHYHSLEALLTHPDVARFVDWIRDRPAGLRPAGRRMRRG